MDKWEYKTIWLQQKAFRNFDDRATDFSEQLNEYGQQGWELVTCYPTNRGTFVYATFKRKI